MDTIFVLIKYQCFQLVLLLGPEMDKGLEPPSSKNCESAPNIKHNKLQSGWSPSPKKLKCNY